MIISNGEPFIRLEEAAKAYFFHECFVDEPLLKHFEHIGSCLSVYAYIQGVCNIFPSAGLTFESDGAFELVKKINGMCKIVLNQPSFELSTYHGAKPSISLSVSSFLAVIPSNLVGSLIIPIDNHINYDNHFNHSYVHLPEFINHAKDVGVEIDVFFLEAIIINDSSFRELKRLSKKGVDGKFNLKQAVSEYLQYFDGVLEETIIQACELASTTYDRQHQETKPPKEKNKDNIDEITEIFSDTAATTENIEQFKNSLPDVWREALFVNSKEMITNIESNCTNKNDPSDKERSNLSKTIGLFTLAFTTLKGNKFGSAENPNAKQIANELEKFLPENSYGLGERTIRGRIKEGINSLKDC